MGGVSACHRPASLPAALLLERPGAVVLVTASGQVEGGMLQGLGYALTEELVLEEGGRPLDARFGPTDGSDVR